MNQQVKNGKIRVVVLFGGKSAEHEVSLKTATNVAAHLDKSLFEVVPVGIDKKGRWFLADATKKIDQQSEAVLPETSKAHEQNCAALAHAFDVVFPAVHGTFCEDGTLQGLLESLNIPYVGCGVLASAIGMDKDIAKRLVKAAGVNVAPYLSFKQNEWRSAPDKILKNILETLSLPVFIKPANTGSSIGITKVKSENKLREAINEAFRFDTKILAEKAINARELEIAALESLTDGAEPIISVVGEIIPTHEFYSYEAKYIDENGANLAIPSNVDQSIKDQAQKMANVIFKTLECEGMARIDLFLDKDTNELYFNEINTLPGFTKISMYPMLMNASGVSYTALLTHLVHLALKRHDSKKKLIHESELVLEKA